MPTWNLSSVPIVLNVDEAKLCWIFEERVEMSLAILSPNAMQPHLNFLIVSQEQMEYVFRDTYCIDHLVVCTVAVADNHCHSVCISLQWGAGQSYLQSQKRN